MEVVKGTGPVDRGDESALLRRILGTILLTLGTALGLAVVMVIYYLLVDEIEVPLLQRLLPASLEARSITFAQGGRLELPPSLFISSSYIVVLMLLAVVASIARGFIAGGVQLLQPDLELLMRKLLRQRQKPNG